MTIRIRYWSWFRDITGTADEVCELPDQARLADALNMVHRRHPRLADARQSTLTAVGVEYQRPDHPLRDGDEVSLFPPVQGG